MKTYKTEFNPTEEQKVLIAKTCGCVRYVYNQYLQYNFDLYKDKGEFVTAFGYSKMINNDVNTPKWLKEVPSKAIKQSIIYAERAFKSYFKGLTGRPKFKKKTGKNSFYLTDTIKVERHRIFVPCLKWLRLKEFGYIPKNVKSVVIRVKAGRYFISCLVDEDYRVPCKLNNFGIGIDFGLVNQFVYGDVKVPSVNKSSRVLRLEKRLKREQRKLSRKYEANMVDKVYYKKGAKKGQLKSYRWLKPLNECKNIQKQKMKVDKIKVRLVNIRVDYNRKAINNIIKQKPSFISVEDLNIQGLLKNKHLASSIQKAQWYYSRNYLLLQCQKYGIELRLVDRFYPSSKLCSSCGLKNKTLKLNDRIWQCKSCGVTHDRDVNASINLRDADRYTVLTAV